MKRVLFLVVVLSSIVAPLACHATEKPGAVRTKIEHYMNEMVKTQHFMGSILVARGNHTIIARGYGLADVKQHIPNTPDTEFRVGSVTKQFTAMAILMLQQDGKLNVQDPICKYMPECPNDWQPITIYELLTHTSGIPGYLDTVPNKTALKILSRPWTPTQLIALFKDKPLAFKPGTKFNYTDSDYVLLGRIVERMSGKNLGQFLQQHIFSALGMKGSVYRSSRFSADKQAKGYQFLKGKFLPGPHVNLTSAFGGGGLLSTVSDLYTWDRALAAHKLIPEPLQKQMFSEQVPMGAIWAKRTDVKGPVYYGFGWAIYKEFGRKEYAHGGRLPNFTAFNSWFPEEDVYVVVLSNSGSNIAATTKIARALAAVVFGENSGAHPASKGRATPGKNVK